MRDWLLLFAAAGMVGLSGNARLVADEQAWGTLKGQVLLDGELPEKKLLVTKGDNGVKDNAICAADDIVDPQFVIDPKSKGFANVVFFLLKRPAQVHPDLEPNGENIDAKKPDEVVLDQIGCRFEPHILLIRTGQKIRLKTQDAIVHNVHTHSIKNPQFNMVLPAQERGGIVLKPMVVAERMPMRVSCDIHPWMSCYWMVLDHPYSAVTDTSGRYEIPHLPVGEHVLAIWHEASGWIDRKYTVTINEGENQQEPMYLAIKKPEAE